MAVLGKWIASVSASDSVVDAARRSLEARLDAVNHWLPLAALEPDRRGVNVHQLRVSARRAVAAVEVFADLLPCKKARRMKRRLKQIRRAAGEARDLDVFAVRMEKFLADSHPAIARDIAERRKTAQRSIEKAHRRITQRRVFSRKAEKLLRGVKTAQGEGNGVTFGRWARQQLGESTRNYFDALPPAGCDADALHRFRIRTKRLRYAMELFAPAFSLDFRHLCYPPVQQLQERLGAINDHASARRRLASWSSSTTIADDKALFGQLAEQEAESLESAIAEFNQWWTSERVEALRAALADVDAVATG